MSNWYDTFPTVEAAEEPQPNWWDKYDNNPARPRATGAASANPQTAAKSIDIAKQSGAPFELVNADPQKSAEDLKLRQTNEAIDRPAIAAYVTSYMPAAEVSNDDYPNLAKIADTTKAFSLPTILDRTVTGFQQGFKTQEPLAFTPEEIAKYPLTYRTWQPFAAPIAALFRLPGGVIGAASAALAETYEQLGGDRPWAMRLERDLNILGLGLITESGMGAKPVEPSPIAKEYLQNGRVPGVGIDPIVDAARSIQAHTDAASLDKTIAETQKSNTLSRSPDAFEEFAKNATQQTISIPAEALAKIYESDPEKLAWIEGIEQKIATALETGGDVEIPLASYLAKGKDLHEGVRDDVRVRAEGLTVNEAKEISKEGFNENLPTYIVKPLEDESGISAATKQTASAEIEALGLRALFKDAAAAGMTEAQFNAYSKKVQRQIEAIEDRAIALSEKEVRKRQTEEWRRNETETKAQVEEELRNQPIHVADREIRADKRLGTVDPDILAPVFGFNSGEAMIRNLELLNNARNVAKQTPLQYFRDLVSKEIARRMETKYGDLAENIFNEARDLALADLHIDLMDTELRALTEQAKGEPPLSREELRDWVRQNHREADLKSASQFEKFQRQAWKNSREAEQALLKGDYILAAKAKQRQLLSFMLAQEAQKLQKEMAAADKLFSRFSVREVPSVDQAFTDRIHQILQMVGQSVKRDSKEIADVVAKQSLEDFVNTWEGNYREVPVAEFLLDGSFRGPLDTLSVDQFRAIHDSIRTLAHNGRDLKTIASVQARAEITEVAGRAVDSLSRFNPVNQPLNKNLPQRASATSRWVQAAHILPERILDYTDKFDPHGPFNEFVDRPIRKSLNKEYELTEEVTKRLNALRDDTVNLYRRIDNDLITDPYDRTGFMNLNRLNLRTIMLNMGNTGPKGNMRKMVEGFGVEEQALKDFVNKHATKADWEWVNGMWDIFKYLKPEVDAMYERISGVAPTSVRATPIDTPFGQYPGGYAPIIYDPMRSRIGESRVRESILEEPDYYRATTPNSYAKERTSATGAIDISGVLIDKKIWQMIHDIAFREAIVNAAKLLTDSEVKGALTKHWGKEYYDQFVPWLKDIANMRGSDDFPATVAAYWSSVIRQNVVSALVTVNPGTIAKHGLSALGLSSDEVGMGSFIQAARNMAATAGKADSQWQFVMDNSPFMRNRMQKYAETVQGAYREATGRGVDITRPTTWRQPIMYYGRSPIVLFDSLSAIPTWLAAYKKAVEAGETVETARFMGDKAVSRAHGSSSVIDKPFVQRVDSEPMKWFTALYNFFNHIFNKQVELVWDTKSAATKILHGEAREPREAAGNLTARFMYRVVWPIMVEEWATSWFDDSDSKKGWGQRISLALIRHLGAGIVGLREFTHAWTSGVGPSGQMHEPSTGMLGAVSKNLTQTLTDIVRKGKGKEPSPDWISHLGTSLGMITGIGGSAPSKVIQFGQKVITGQEKPQNLYQVAKGLRKGSIRERRH